MKNTQQISDDEINRLINTVVFKNYGYLSKEIKDDLFQIGFFGLIEGLKKFNKKKNDNRDAYLYFYISNRIKDYTRKFYRQTGMDFNFKPSQEYLPRHIDFDWLRCELLKLPPKWKNLIKLRYFDDKDLCDIAKLMKKHKSVISRMLSKIERHLKLAIGD